MLSLSQNQAVVNRFLDRPAEVNNFGLQKLPIAICPKSQSEYDLFNRLSISLSLSFPLFLSFPLPQIARQSLELH